MEEGCKDGQEEYEPQTRAARPSAPVYEVHKNITLVMCQTDMLSFTRFLKKVVLEEMAQRNEVHKVHIRRGNINQATGLHNDIVKMPDGSSVIIPMLISTKQEWWWILDSKAKDSKFIEQLDQQRAEDDEVMEAEELRATNMRRRQKEAMRGSLTRKGSKKGSSRADTSKSPRTERQQFGLVRERTTNGVNFENDDSPGSQLRAKEHTRSSTNEAAQATPPYRQSWSPSRPHPRVSISPATRGFHTASFSTTAFLSHASLTWRPAPLSSAPTPAAQASSGYRALSDNAQESPSRQVAAPAGGPFMDDWRALGDSTPAPGSSISRRGDVWRPAPISRVAIRSEDDQEAKNTQTSALTYVWRPNRYRSQHRDMDEGTTWRPDSASTQSIVVRRALTEETPGQAQDVWIPSRSRSEGREVLSTGGPSDHIATVSAVEQRPGVEDVWRPSTKRHPAGREHMSTHSPGSEDSWRPTKAETTKVPNASLLPKGGSGGPTKAEVVQSYTPPPEPQSLVQEVRERDYDVWRPNSTLSSPAPRTPPEAPKPTTPEEDWGDILKDLSNSSKDADIRKPLSSRLRSRSQLPTLGWLTNADRTRMVAGVSLASPEPFAPRFPRA